MKTSIKTLIVLAAMFMLPKFTQAQAPINPPYNINNNMTTCNVVVQWYIVDSGGSCGSSGTGAVISPGSFVTLGPSDFAGCGTVTAIKVEVLKIGGNTTGLPVQIDPVNSTVMLPTAASCIPAGSSPMGLWNMNQCDINP